MKNLLKWVSSSLQNMGIGLFVAALVLLGAPSSLGASGVLWAVTMLVIGSMMIGASFLIELREFLKGES